MIDFAISREDGDHGGQFVLKHDGQPVGELTYSRVDATTVVIEYVGVDPPLRGRGYGRRLIDAAVSWARQTGTKLRPSCSYAVAEFSRDKSIGDVLP